MTITIAMKHRLHHARTKLSAAPCTCGGKHDPFWIQCPRTTAEIERDEAVRAMGFDR